MVDFQSRDTRRGPPLDDEEDEPDDEGDPPDEPAADEETDPTAEPAADEEGDSHPADGDPDGEGIEVDPREADSHPYRRLRRDPEHTTSISPTTSAQYRVDHYGDG